MKYCAGLLLIKKPIRLFVVGLMFLNLSGLSAFAAVGTSNNNVVQRQTTATRPATTRINTTSRMPSIKITDDIKTLDDLIEEIVDEDLYTEEVVIDNKSSQFDNILDKSSGLSGDLTADSRAEMIRAQRAALDSRDTKDTAAKVIEKSLSSGRNSCDTGLRNCMAQKCNTNFSNCILDGDTIFGDKLNSCRTGLNCSAQEFSLFAKEIKADRDNNSNVASYDETIKCGTAYNTCIFKECGNNMQACLNKNTEILALQKCSQIASDCQTIDSGFASRTMQVFGTLRSDAEKQVVKDEARLYELRDLMASQCKRLGAMFDERSLDCIYTVNFSAGPQSTLFSSQKLYAGSSFDCHPDWFGVDVTTYKENAQRLTREQTGATSGLMGAGVGIAAGTIASGAINRAIDTQKAERAIDTSGEQQPDSNIPGVQTDASVTSGTDNGVQTPQVNATTPI